MTKLSKALILVLDLDETLVFSSSMRPDPKLKFHEFDDNGSLTFIYERPFLASFLKHISPRYTLAVWTAAEREYARFIVHNILYQYIPKEQPLKFFYTREQAEFSKAKTGILKNLDFLIQNNERVILIDDNPLVRNQQALVITVEPFEGEPTDNVLKQLVDLL